MRLCWIDLTGHQLLSVSQPFGVEGQTARRQYRAGCGRRGLTAYARSPRAGHPTGAGRSGRRTRMCACLRAVKLPIPEPFHASIAQPGAPADAERNARAEVVDGEHGHRHDQAVQSCSQLDGDRLADVHLQIAVRAKLHNGHPERMPYRRGARSREPSARGGP